MLYDKEYFLNSEIKGNFDELWSVINILRRECPWDRSQTAQSIKFKLVEESYEAIDSLDRQDFEGLAKELGDVILVCLFITKIMEDEGKFDLKFLFSSLIKKLIQRHPHVFGNKDLKTPEEVLQNWERMKKKEEKEGNNLSDVEKIFPSLYLAYRIYEKKINMGDLKIDGIYLKTRALELFSKLLDLIENEEKSEKEKVADTLSEILLNLVLISLYFKINPEEELRKKIKQLEKGEKNSR
jgi:MazG family protein